MTGIGNPVFLVGDPRVYEDVVHRTSNSVLAGTAMVSRAMFLLLYSIGLRQIAC
jgi:hypothetical protein